MNEDDIDGSTLSGNNDNAALLRKYDTDSGDVFSRYPGAFGLRAGWTYPDSSLTDSWWLSQELGPPSSGQSADPVRGLVAAGRNTEVPDQVIPQKRGFYQRAPYDDRTFVKIKQMAPYINRYAKEYDVPPLAVAGAIAEEYNTRFNLSLKNLINYDEFQDSYIPTLSSHPTWSWHDNEWLPSGISALRPAYADSPGWLHSDVGPGNVRLGTAVKLWHSNLDKFPDRVKDYQSLAKYAASDEGNSNLAAMYIAAARKDFDSILRNTQKPLSSDDKTALYVDYYRQGPEVLFHHWTRRLKNQYQPDQAHALISGQLALPSDALPVPHDGVRVITNKAALRRMLDTVDDNGR